MRRTVLAFSLYCMITTSSALLAQTFTTLVTFSGPNGANPVAGLVQGADGNLYGTTFYGGRGRYSICDGDGNGCGTVFKVTTDGTLNTLHVFCSEEGCADGSEPSGALTIGSDGNFYGTTQQGGRYNGGTVFKITSAGAMTTLHSFSGVEGFDPEAGLVLASDGNFYGTTKWGGTNGDGTVFRMTPGGAVTTVYSFCAQNNCSDGYSPLGTLIQATDGELYGTTAGANFPAFGTVFKITLSSTLTTVHSFDGDDGGDPDAGLVQAKDGNFYGTTSWGGTEGGNGTAFKMAPDGTLTTLHSFGMAWNDGLRPYAPLIQANDGNFYGTTSGGGDNGWGILFDITPGGELTTLHSFGMSDGLIQSALLLATDGNLYGTGRGPTNCAGTCGTVFRLEISAALSVSKSGTGNVTSGDGHIYCGGVCAYPYPKGTQVGLTAIPAPGYTFSSWTGCDNAQGSFCTVMMSSAKNVTATFTTSNVGLTSLVLNPSSVKGGNISIATITLNAPAPSGGLSVGVATDSPLAVHPPSVVTIPPGVTSYSFPVRTSPVRTKTVANVIASAGTSQVTAPLTVTTGYGSAQEPSEPQR